MTWKEKEVNARDLGYADGYMQQVQGDSSLWSKAYIEAYKKGFLLGAADRRGDREREWNYEN